MTDKEKNSIYPKSNFLIGAKYKSSLLENQIMAYALSKIRTMDFENNNDRIICSFNISELRRLCGGNSGSFYSKLDPVARAMTGRTVGMSNPETKTFDYVAIIIRSTYENGVFSIEFNRNLKNYITNIKENFTKLNLEIEFSFRNVYSFKLYELLKSMCYRPKWSAIKSNEYDIEFKLSELKLSLGVINAELDGVRRILSGKKNPDFDLAVEKSPEKQFEDWYSFKKRVLFPAVKEINEKSDMEVTFDTKRSGRGGKTDEVIFHVTLYPGIKSKIDDIDNIDNMEDVDKLFSGAENMSQAEKDAVMDALYDMLDFKLKMKDARAIAEAADYNLLNLERAYLVLQGEGEKVEDPVAFMIAACKKQYIASKRQLAELKKKGIITIGNNREEEYEQMEIPLDFTYTLEGSQNEE